MALNFPITPTDGQQYIDENNIVWQYSSVKGVWNKFKSNQLKEFIGSKIVFTADKSLTTVLSPCPFDLASFDTGQFFTQNSPSHLTANRTGYYRINVLVQTGTEGTGASYTFSVRKNGTVNLTTETAGANQFVFYDDILLLTDGDYIELWASELSAVGTITTSCFLEIQRVGFALGSTFSTSDAFSGVKLLLDNPVSTTSILSPLDWDTSQYNINADINGNVYWNPNSASRVDISTTGYYRIKSFIQTNTDGTSDSYTIDLRLDGSTLESGSLGPVETLELDEVYNFTSGSYLQFFVNNSGSIGEITTDSFFQMTRLGV
jgi:hypothetical protein